MDHNLTAKAQRQLDASIEQVNRSRERGDLDALAMGCKEILKVLRPPSTLAAVEADPHTGGPVTEH